MSQILTQAMLDARSIVAAPTHGPELAIDPALAGSCGVEWTCINGTGTTTIAGVSSTVGALGSATSAATVALDSTKTYTLEFVLADAYDATFDLKHGTTSLVATAAPSAGTTTVDFTPGSTKTDVIALTATFSASDTLEISSYSIKEKL